MRSNRMRHMMVYIKGCLSTSLIVSVLGFASICVAQTPQPVVPIQTWQTAQGAQVYFVRAPEIPMLNMAIAFRAGSARDEKAYGLAYLTNDVMAQGTEKLSAEALAQGFENIGADFSDFVDRDKAGFSLTTLVDKQVLQQATELFAEVVAHPGFKPEVVSRQKNILLQAIKQATQSPDEVADQVFYHTLYGNSPYGHPVIGLASTVEALTPAALRDFYRQHYTARNATLVMVGDISKSQAKTIADRVTAALATGHLLPTLKVQAKALTMTPRHVAHHSSQTAIRIGQNAVDRHSPDFMALYVGNAILGGDPLISRLKQAVRDDKGLSYVIYSGFNPLAIDGPFITTLQTRKDQADQAVNVVRSTLARFIQQGPTQQELDFAKQSLAGRLPIALSSNASILSNVMNVGFYHLPLDYFDTRNARIQSLSQKDIMMAFQRHLQLKHMATILVGEKPEHAPS